MCKTFLLFIFSVLCLKMQAQNNVGIGTATPDASSLLELQATDRGVLIPRMTTTQRTAIASPAQGLMVYDVTVNCFYFYNNSAWVSLCSTGGAQGPTGAQGATGVAGVTGLQGITGPTGIGSICNTATTNQVVKFTSPADLCNSIITDDGTHVGIGNSTPTEKLDVAGNVKFSGALMPNNLPGNVGDILTSQGTGVPPVWKPGVRPAAYSALSTRTTISSLSYTNITGLTLTITLTDSSLVFITTHGAMETTSTDYYGGSICRIGVFNGATVVDEETVDVLNNGDIYDGTSFRTLPWSMSNYQVLGAGTYTFQVEAKSYDSGFSPFYAGGAINSGGALPNEGVIAIMVFPYP